jgi:putative membrane protein
MTQAALDEAVADPPGERLHPLYLLTGLGKVARNAWGLIAGGAILALRDQMGLALLLLAGFTLLSAISLLVRWLTFEFRIGEHEIRVDQGLLSRSSRAIPFDRVTDVDIEQGPLHRLFGLARVRIETGASGAAAAEEGVLEAVALARAEAIREHVRSRRRAASVQTEAAEEGEPLFAMDSRRLATLGLFNFSLAVIAALFGASQTVGELIGFDPFSRAFWSDFLSRAGPLRDYVAAHRAVAIAGGTALLILLGIATGVVRTFLREHGFRLERTETGFRRRRGLLTLTDVTIPARRVQASILATGPIRRAFGWFALKFQSLAMDGKQGDHVVAPLAREGEAAAIQESLGRPIAPDDPDAWRKIARGHFTSAAAILLPAIALALAAGLLLEPLNLLAAGALGLALAARWLDWRRARYALTEGHMFIDSGWWRQRRSIIPLGRIQSIDLAESFWTRAFRFCRLRLGIAGGTLLAGYSIDALDRAEAEALRDRLLVQ